MEVTRRPARPLTVALVLLAGLLLGSCAWVEQLNARAYHRYHDSRWNAVAEAVAQRAAARLPGIPVQPLICAADMDDGYSSVAALSLDEQTAWRTLLARSAASVEYGGALVVALTSRNIAAIEQLAPQLPQVREEQAQAQAAWLDARGSVQAQVDLLDEQWTVAWPGQDLNFALEPAAAAARRRLKPPPEAELAEQFRKYHRNEYARLAMVYLGYEPPEGPPAPFSAPPPGAAEVAAALQRLEAALTVRFNLDEAIELDVQRVLEAQPALSGASPNEPAGAEGAAIDWETLADGGRRYQQQRAAVSIARLKLLKSVDELLTRCTDIELAEVREQWSVLWPQNDLETSIFAFAGLQAASGAAPANPAADIAPVAGAPDLLRDLSFRH